MVTKIWADEGENKFFICEGEKYDLLCTVIYRPLGEEEGKEEGEKGDEEEEEGDEEEEEEGGG